MKTTTSWATGLRSSMSRLSLTISLCFILFTSYTQVGYVKRFNGSPDWIEIAGKNSFGGTVDGGTMTLNRTSGNQNFQTYLFNRKGTNNTSIIAFRQDSAANSKSIGLLITRDSIKVIKRTNKAGVSTILSKYAAPSFNSYWIRISRSGTGFSAFFSADNPTNTIPSWVLLNTTTGAFSGWADAYWKALGVCSQSSSIASTEFSRYAGGPFLGTITDSTIVTTPTTPTCTFAISATLASSTSVAISITKCQMTSGILKLKLGPVILSTTTYNSLGSSITLPIPLTATTGTYTVELTSNTDAVVSSTFTYTAPAPVATAWVEHPNGVPYYNADGTLNKILMSVSLSGQNNNIVTATTTKNCPNGYTLCSSFDSGNYQYGGSISGWVPGIPTGTVMVPDGRMHTLSIGCVGDIWGGGSNQGIVDVSMEYFRVGGIHNSTIVPDANLTYLDYTPNFQPVGNKRIPQFFTQFPDFVLNGKYNTTSIGVPKSVETFDLRKRGFAFWQHYGAAKATYPSSVNYQLDADTWAGGAWNNVDIMNNASTTQAQNWGTQFANCQGGVVRGSIVRDGEYRGMGSYTDQGLRNEFEFFRQAKATAPNASIAEHQCAPYKTPALWYRGELWLADLNKPARAGYSKDDIIRDISPLSHQSWFWLPVNGLQAGENAGAYMDINVSAYTSTYNSSTALYSIAWELWVNKKYFPTKKVTTVVEGFDEVSVYGSKFASVIESWKWTGGAATNWVQPKWSGAMFEGVAALSNFLGDGITIWESTGPLQESDPSAYYCNNSLIGTAAGMTNQNVINAIGTYPNVNKITIDYAIAAMEKHSRIPTDIIQSNTFEFEISMDGATWITGDNLNPLQLSKDKKPMAWGMTNATGTKFVILAIYPLNTPENQTSFWIRGNGLTSRKVTVNGQYPELIIYQ